jgi:putative ABC transport system substrate-binding protein
MRLNTVRFVVMLALVILTAPLRAEAQHVGKVPRIGFLRAGPLPQDFLQGFQQGLRDHGYIEGQNIIIEYRLTDGSTGALANLVAELLQGKVDVVVVSGMAAALAAKNATPTVPIVMAGVIDPVDSGLVGSLARPGGNITGMSLMSVDLIGKRVGLLKDLVPQLRASPSWGIRLIQHTRPRRKRRRQARGLSECSWQASTCAIRRTLRPPSRQHARNKH